jgi:hypothetical protein
MDAQANVVQAARDLSPEALVEAVDQVQAGIAEAKAATDPEADQRLMYWRTMAAIVDEECRVRLEAMGEI